MANNFDLDALFGQESTPVYQTAQVEVDKNIFKPKAANQPTKEYSCILRFLPYFEMDQDGKPTGGKKSILTKLIASVPNVNNQNLCICDNPETIGERSNAVSNPFWDLWRNADQLLKDKLKQCSLNTEKNYALVQILKNQSEPNTVGQIKIFEFGKSIHKLIIDAKNDEDAGGDAFDLTPEAPVLVLKLGTKSVSGKEVNDVNNCKCVYLKQYDFVINEEGEQVKLDGSDPAALKAWKMWFLNNIPSWSRYAYKEPTAEQLKKISENYQTYYNFAGRTGGPAPVSQAAPASDPKTQAKAAEADIPANVETKNADGAMDFDDILNNL